MARVDEWIKIVAGILPITPNKVDAIRELDRKKPRSMVAHCMSYVNGQIAAGRFRPDLDREAMIVSAGEFDKGVVEKVVEALKDAGWLECQVVRFCDPRQAREALIALKTYALS